jgi:phosphoglycolate phosphatase
VPLIVFDLDGTLIDSQEDLAGAANALITEHGGSELSVSEIAAMVGDGAAVLVRRVMKAAGLTDVRDALQRFLELYDERLLRTTRLYRGMDAVLDELSGKASLAVLTNKPARATNQILEGLGVANMFQWVIGGDSAFGRKPDPAGLLHLVSQANCLPRETIMIGDSAVDVATARAAGTRMCIARYGFGFRPAAVDPGADDVVVDRPEEIVLAVRQVLAG